MKTYGAFELLTLSDFTWVAIDQESLGIGIGHHFVLDHGQNGLEGHQTAGLHNFIQLLTTL